MNDKKMISIDQFSADERVAIDEALNGLIDKYRQRTGKEPDSKKEKELNAEARQAVMAIKLEKEKAEAERKMKKPQRKKKPTAMKESEVGNFNWSDSVSRGRR